MNEVTALLFDLFLVFLAARLAGELFERLQQPALVGELLVGMLVGPYALRLIGIPDTVLVTAFHGDLVAAQEAMDLVYHLFAELGVVVLLFFVGLETRLTDILKVGGRAGQVAVLGAVIPFALGYGWMGPLLGRPSTEAIFMGAAMMATSAGITARVLRDLGVIASTESRIILGAAVIDDILAMIVLAVVAGMATTGSVSLLGIGIITGQALLFTAVVTVVGTAMMRRYGFLLGRLKMDGTPLAVSLLAMLGLAAVSASIGLAAIIGAFLAGMVFAEVREHFELEPQVLPIYRFLVPFFFVLTGAQVDWHLFLDGGIMSIAVAVTLLALMGKMVGCGAVVLGLGRRSAAIVGVGMAPRGDVGLIVASLGLSLGAISTQIFSVVVIMSILTTLVVPPILRVLYMGRLERAVAGEAADSRTKFPLDR